MACEQKTFLMSLGFSFGTSLKRTELCSVFFWGCQEQQIGVVVGRDVFCKICGVLEHVVLRLHCPAYPERAPRVGVSSTDSDFLFNFQ